MVYRVIGLMSGSSLDGLDIAFVEFHEQAGAWSYEIKATECYAYSAEWVEKLKKATSLNAADYQLLHTAYGHYTGQLVNAFIEEYGLDYQVQLIASHGHTTFHMPAQKMTAQLGDGAAVAAATGINVVSDLRAMDVALGGNGAPIVPIGEKLLLKDYPLFLNLGGIANVSCNLASHYIAYDVCPANRVLNMLANKAGKSFDEGGQMAAGGTLQPELLNILNALEYYHLPGPKSLANDFGTDVVFPLVTGSRFRIKDTWIQDSLRTYVEHIAVQVKNALSACLFSGHQPPAASDQPPYKLLVTGGGAHNTFLIDRLATLLREINIDVVVPDKKLIDYKEAIIMALIGVLRWREENNVLASVTGSLRNSIGGAVWIGQEA
ncbi:anhydro-N-acetylmuramic acid kinase [Pseudoflavitalea sp. X16]|uniref:anhydro-N-acetylmuramic acid kinase n=1 Tax=Paraflavitalea devenefica TaxID=2716334 RepID=UPI0014219762|nr:anhydro-N-acetylmuramic acid kinase [Paraflavitalea devenefica]NII25069.1 anhydro-N-acetylmuramic acid kinase [Paraflavitalea devenefica]